MPIRVEQRLRTLMIDAGGVAIQVRRCRDQELAVEALRQAAAEIVGSDEDEEFPSPSYASPVTLVPGGAFVWINIGNAHPEVVQRIPDVIAGYLARVGLNDALIGELKSELQYAAVRSIPNCVFGRIYLIPSAVRGTRTFPQELAHTALPKARECFHSPTRFAWY